MDGRVEKEVAVAVSSGCGTSVVVELIPVNALGISAT